MSTLRVQAQPVGVAALVMNASSLAWIGAALSTVSANCEANGTNLVTLVFSRCSAWHVELKLCH